MSQPFSSLGRVASGPHRGSEVGRGLTPDDVVKLYVVGDHQGVDRLPLITALSQVVSLGNGVIRGPACKWWEVALEVLRGLLLEAFGVGSDLVGEVMA